MVDIVRFEDCQDCSKDLVCGHCPSPGSFPVVFVCNENAITDDWWKIYINGIFSADYDIGNEYRALYILPAEAASLSLVLSPVTGSNCTSLFNYSYTPALSAPTMDKYLFEMLRWQDNLNGNYGSFKVLCGTISGGNFNVSGDPIASFIYDRTPPIGESVYYQIGYGAG